MEGDPQRVRARYDRNFDIILTISHRRYTALHAPWTVSCVMSVLRVVVGGWNPMMLLIRTHALSLSSLSLSLHARFATLARHTRSPSHLTHPPPPPTHALILHSLTRSCTHPSAGPMHAGTTGSGKGCTIKQFKASAPATEVTAEIAILKKLSQPNIVKLLHIATGGDMYGHFDIVLNHFGTVLLRSTLLLSEVRGFLSYVCLPPPHTRAQPNQKTASWGIC